MNRTARVESSPTRAVPIVSLVLTLECEPCSNEGMTFQVRLYERDETVGHPGARVDRQFVIATVDTLPHALRVLRDNERRVEDEWRIVPRTVHTNAGVRNEFPITLIGRGHGHEYGNVIRTMRFDIAVAR